jgi:hypothetical protein
MSSSPLRMALERRRGRRHPVACGGSDKMRPVRPAFPLRKIPHGRHAGRGTTGTSASGRDLCDPEPVTVGQRTRRKLRGCDRLAVVLNDDRARRQAALHQERLQAARQLGLHRFPVRKHPAHFPQRRRLRRVAQARRRIKLKPAVHLTADVADVADRRAEMTPSGAGENLTWQVHGASYPSS